VLPGSTNNSFRKDPSDSDGMKEKIFSKSEARTPNLSAIGSGDLRKSIFQKSDPSKFNFD